MTDNIDAGTKTAELFLKVALSNRVVYSGVSATHCFECEGEIPVERAKSIAGCRLCFDCANEIEEASKRYISR